MTELNIAVLIDFENIAAGAEKEGMGKVEVGLIMNRLREKGRVSIARSYADWGRFARFKKDMMFEGVTLFELSAHGMNDKNRADVALVVDCMELAFSREYIDTFVVVSGDSDFTPLVSKLRELNKRVIGLGTRRSTSRLIVEACDEFIFYDTLHQQKHQKTRRSTDRPEDRAKRLSKEEAMELVTAALDAMQRDDGASVHASRIKESILRKEPSFSEQDLGYTNFARFLEYCQKQGIVKLERDARAGGYQVTGPDGDLSPSSQEPLVQLGADAARIYDMLSAEDTSPLTRSLRQTACELIVSNVADRESRNRRVNLQWVTQDVGKTLRQQESRVANRQVRGLVDLLHGAGLFRHTDGEPIRSFFASFKLDHDAKGLMRALDVALMRKAMELGVPAKDTSVLAELVFEDASKTREIEEMLAWEMTEAVEALDDKPKAARKAASADADDEDRGKRRRARRKTGDDAEDAAPVEAAPVEEPKPKRRKPRKKVAPKTADAPAEAAEAKAVEPKKAESKEAEPPAAAEASSAEPAAEEAPKPKTRRTRTRKKAEPKVEASADDASEAPAKKTRTVRRKSTPKAATKTTKAAAEAEPAADAG